MESPETKESFVIQNQIRENSNAMRDSLLELQNWEQEIKIKEKSVRGDYSVTEVIFKFFDIIVNNICCSHN